MVVFSFPRGGRGAYGFRCLSADQVPGWQDRSNVTVKLAARWLSHRVATNVARILLEAGIIIRYIVQPLYGIGTTGKNTLVQPTSRLYELFLYSGPRCTMYELFLRPGQRLRTRQSRFPSRCTKIPPRAQMYDVRTLFKTRATTSRTLVEIQWKRF